MKKKRKKTKCGSLPFAAAAIGIILLLIVGTVRTGNYFVSQIRTKVRSTTVQVVSEMTSAKASIINGLLSEARTDLRILASELETEQGDMPDKLLETFCESHHTEALAVVDGQGTYLYGSETELALHGLPESFVSEVKQKGNAMSDVVPNTKGNRQILFGAVIPGGGCVYTALSASALQVAYGETTYQGEGYSYILEPDGDIMVSPVRYSYEQIYGNIQKILEDGGNSEHELHAFLDALADGKTGSVVFTFDGEAQLICFEPLRTEKNWQFVTVVPVAAVEEDGAQIIQNAMYMAGIIMALITVAMAVCVFFYLMLLHRQKENDRFLRSIYQAISENTDTAIFILDDKSSMPDYIFENCSRLFGIAPDEFLDCKETAEDKETFRGKILSLLRTQRPKEGCETEIHAYNDRLERDMWLKALICPFRLGDSAKHIFAFTDVTEEHNAREKITAAVAAAEQANAAKSSFLANMSHDMRTPMNGIVGMTAIAKLYLDEPKRVQDCLEKIDISSQHLLGLINDVLDMSKIESGKFALASEPFDLRELILGVGTMVRPQCDAKNQTIDLFLNIKHARLLGDTVRLNQIFMNLLSNAHKFTPEGGSITVSAEELEQKHSAYAAFRFSVTDTGVGMPPEFMKVLFKPFERAGNPTIQKTEGTGLGMAITKNLVTAMGGQISVESKKDCGSVFVVELELPMAENVPEAGSADREAQEEKPDYTGMRFLFTEDNELNREIGIELFSRCGASVEPVENGKQALERFVNSEPGYYDAILMDIQMPVMNGYEAARAIRSSAHPQSKTIPIIAMTANAFAEDVKAALEAGMNAHIAKPIDMRVVYKTLKKVLEAGKIEAD